MNFYVSEEGLLLSILVTKEAYLCEKKKGEKKLAFQN